MQEEKNTAAGLCVYQRTQLLRLKEYSNPYRGPDLLIVSSHMSAVPEVDVQIEYGQVSVCSSIPCEPKARASSYSKHSVFTIFMATIDIYDVIETGYF